MLNSYRISMNRRQFVVGSAAATAAVAASSPALAFSSQKGAVESVGRSIGTARPTSLCADLHARIGAHLAETERACGTSRAPFSYLAKTSKCPHCATRIGATV